MLLFLVSINIGREREPSNTNYQAIIEHYTERQLNQQHIIDVSDTHSYSNEFVINEYCVINMVHVFNMVLPLKFCCCMLLFCTCHHSLLLYM